MRIVIVTLAVALASSAYADPKIQQLVTGYQREARSCKIQGDGVAKVLEGANVLRIEDDDVSYDIHQLEEARDAAQAFCSELATVIDLLRGAASYKDVQSELAEHDTRLRTLRRASKQAVEGVAPIIRRLVPRINKRAGSAPDPKPETKPVEPPPAPTPPPAPAAPVMSDGPTTTLSVHAFTGGSCDDQAKRVYHDGDWDRAATKKGSLAWLPGARWKLSYAEGDRFVETECVANKTGGYILTLESHGQRDVIDLALRALR